MPDPFITVTDLGHWLGRDLSSDNGATIAVDAACDIVRDVAEQSFNAGTATAVLDGTGSDAILLPELPVTAAGTVLVDGAAVEDGYYLDVSRGILFRGSAGALPRPVWPAGRGNVTVTYEHGYSAGDMPRSIRMVALAIAARIVVQGVASEESVGSVRVKYATAATDLTSGERLILEKYRPKR